MELPNNEFQALVPKLRERDFYTAQPQRPIDWPAYTRNQIEGVIDSLDFIRDAVDAVPLSRRKGPGRPLTNPHSLAKAILLCEALHIDERSAQGWIDILGPRIAILEPLDDRVIGDASTKLEVLYILDRVFESTKDSDGRLAGDGTGLEHSRKQNYESTKERKGTYMTSIVDSREIVQAFSISHTGECKLMHELIKRVEGNSLRLDAGFVDRKLVEEIHQLSMVPYIFPKKNIRLNGRLAWKRMYLSLLNNVMEWLIEYHQRSHTESFHSSIKRINGPITKKRAASKLAQITARIILYNRRRLAYFQGIAAIE